MKNLFLKTMVLLGLLCCSVIIIAQGIRKDYLEMSDAERDAVIDAYWELADDLDEDGPVGGLVGEIGDYHGINFFDIHFNDDENDVFLAWHRQTSVELERAMKNTMSNEWITIPYWDWTLSASKGDELWGLDWLEPFDIPWGLGRDPVGGEPLATDADIDAALLEPNFFQFSRWEVESDPIHTAGHGWIGGIMVTGESPHDPAFFFHHNMVDKIWADWYEIHHFTGADYYIKTDMPRYDGTYTNFLGETLPSVDPDDIADPRSLGIFYAENGMVVLDKYTVANLETTNESFGYQYTIEAKDDFIVPSGNTATFRSCSKIVLGPGFHAEKGSTFTAASDSDCDFTTAARLAQPQFSNSSLGKGSGISNANSRADDKAQQLDFETVQMNAKPNPFQNATDISLTLSKEVDVRLTILDVNGREILELVNSKLKKGKHLFTWNAQDFPSGVYIARLANGEEIKTIRIVLAR